jgi:hypothetical protein
LPQHPRACQDRGVTLGIASCMSFPPLWLAGKRSEVE